MRARTVPRGSCRPASSMPTMAARTASPFMRMKSTRVLSRSKTMARITRVLRTSRRFARCGCGSLGGRPDRAPQRDLAVVDPHVEAARRIAAHPRLVRDRRAVAAVIGERQQHAVLALAAIGELRLHELLQKPAGPSEIDPTF